jgi:N-methylhydantoinase B
VSGADPISSAVVRAALVSTAEEVFLAFERTAMHPTIYEAHDYSVSVFDDRFNLVADAAGLPEFVGSLGFAVEFVARHFQARGGFREGDVAIANDPFDTGAHPPDIAVIAPAVCDGRVLGFCAVRGHMGDLGMKDPYPTDSASVYEEGLLLPPVKILDAGRPQESLFEIIAANSRMPRETVGNLRAAVNAARQGARKISDVIAEHGVDIYRAAIEELLDRGEHEARAVLQKIADGDYYADGWLEQGEGLESVPLRCKVTIEGSEMTVDVSDSGPQQPGPVNSTLPHTVSACRLALKRLSTEDSLTANSGEHRPLTVIAPAGTVFNAIRPAPTFLLHSPTSQLSEMIITALAPALPDRLPAPSAGSATGFSGSLDLGGGWTEFDDLAPIGLGATSQQDGANALQNFCIAGILLAEAEPWEARAPVVKEGSELVQDSGGAGRRRGGLGARVAWRFQVKPLMMNTTAQRVLHRVQDGLAGGRPGSGTNEAELHRADGSVERFGIRAELAVREGDTIVLNGAGGGGYGDPMDREVELVQHDVREGYVSIGAARDLFGVVLEKDTFRIDTEATELERGRRRRPPPDEGHQNGATNPEPDIERNLAPNG